MRTTFDLPAPLLHRAHLIAEERRVTLNKLITEVLETAFHEPAPAPRRVTVPPVPFEATGPLPALTSRQIAELFEEEDLRKHESSRVSIERLSPRTQRLAGCLPASASADVEEYLDYLETKHS